MNKSTMLFLIGAVLTHVGVFFDPGYVTTSIGGACLFAGFLQSRHETTTGHELAMANVQMMIAQYRITASENKQDNK